MQRQLCMEYSYHHEHGLEMSEDEQVELLKWCKHKIAASDLRTRKIKSQMEKNDSIIVFCKSSLQTFL